MSSRSMSIPVVAALALAAMLATMHAAAANGKNGRLEALKNALAEVEVMVLRRELRDVKMESVETMRGYLADAERGKDGDIAYAQRVAAEVEGMIEQARSGVDPLASKRGFFWRAYRSPFSSRPQLYSIYVPKSYEPGTPIPLIVTLHGGSSNHNVWLAMMLGNEVAPADYRANFQTRYKALRHPDAIVVAPEGFGQIRWRWMGERDVFDVIEDVARVYSIDRDRIVLTGLSNGGIGAYTIGLKNASVFSAVAPQAGVTHWPSYIAVEQGLRPAERRVLENESAVSYAANAANTSLVFYHGVKDPGMKVDQARRLARLLERFKISFVYKELEHLGHDLSHVLWRDLRIMDIVRASERRERPATVRLTTTTERYGRQAWVELDDRFDHTSPASIDARLEDGRYVITTQNVARFTVFLDETPSAEVAPVVVDGAPAGVTASEGARYVTFARSEANGAWGRWNERLPAPGTAKVGTLCGPIGDANFEPQVHVYGSLVAKDIAPLRRAAELGARAWMLGRDYSDVRQPVVRDTELNEKIIGRRVLVLYGNARNNAVIARIADELPIKVGEDFIGLRDRILTDPSAGARFVCPDPLAPSRYVVVNAGNSAAAVEEGAQNLPIYLPDYIVYDRRTTRRRSSMHLGRMQEVEMGFFDEGWQLPELPAEEVSRPKDR